MNGDSQDADTIDAAVADFLRTKGTLEMVVRIGEQGSQRNTDLREALLLSSSTIQQRLKTGKQHGLWTQTLEQQDDIAAKVYQLTPLGETIYTTATDLDLDQLYRIRRGLIRELDQRERRTIINASPPDAAWLTDLSMDDHELRSVQQFLDQWPH